MFKIKIQLIGLHSPVKFQQPLTLRLRKQHWHYALIDNITTPILNYEHQFIIREEEQKDTCFQLQLLVRTSPQRGKIIGSAIINIKEWPLERPKRDKVSLSPQIWLDITLSYKYIMSKTPSQSSFDVQLFQMEYQQEMKEKQQQNTFIRHSKIELQAQLLQLQTNNKLLIQKKQQIAYKFDKLEKDHKEAKRRIEKDKQKIENQIIEAKLIVTKLVNMINQSGVVDVVQKLNNFLVKQLALQ